MKGDVVRILIEIEDMDDRSHRGADPMSAAGKDEAEEAVQAGPGPGASAETSDEPAADGGGPSASLLDEVAAAEQLSRDGDTAEGAEGADAGAGPLENSRG